MSAVLAAKSSRPRGRREDRYQPRLAGLAHFSTGFYRDTGGNEQVQGRVFQGDGLTRGFEWRTTRSRTGYGWPHLLGDASGGMIAALIALPYGLAMASLMGLPPVLGVFTSILTAPVIALLGRNPVLIGGTASATVPFIALAVRNQGIVGAAKVSLVA